MGISNRRWLALLMLAWWSFALLLAGVFPLFQEQMVEAADIMGLDVLGGFASTFLLAVAVFVPLVLILILHARGGFDALARRLTPRGRALERNKPGITVVER